MISYDVERFYDRFPYPSAPDTYARLLNDPWLFAKAIAQETGRRGWFPQTIWVAGCGAMQALNTALAFPNAEVVGTDISEEQLERCRVDAKQVGAPNLELRRFNLESGSTWDRKFDYVICTGVIHHLPTPSVGLMKLQAALTATGLLELMVYHTYHVQRYAAFSSAIRTLLGTTDHPDFEKEWELARGLVGNAGVPDTLIHPIIHHYTMRSLTEMVDACHLRFVQPRHNHESKTATWNIINAVEAAPEWKHLSDLERWTVSSELQFERSPLLWFYLQSKESNLPTLTTDELDAAFAKAKRAPFRARLQPYVRDAQGLLHAGAPIPFPPPPPPTYTSRLQLSTQANSYMEIL